MISDYVAVQATRAANSIAVSAPDGRATYGELDTLSNRLANALLSLGVGKGDRVGIWVPKSIRAVTLMQAVLRIGASYVPLDPLSPLARIHKIVADCDLRVLCGQARDLESMQDLSSRYPHLLCVDDEGPGLPWRQVNQFPTVAAPRPEVADSDLAYILYTSGSTGTPKGVCISHGNAEAFVDWASTEVAVTSTDRLANHASFSVDLSVFDLYAAFRAGASVALLPERLAFLPRGLVDFLLSEDISIWYSVPSVLVLMMEQGGLLDSRPRDLRAVIFAGEPFAARHLNRLRDHLPAARLWNWYGPTETNVCTSFEVTTLSPTRSEPVPIGKPSCGNRCWIQPSIEDPSRGELFVEGPTVMLGYWGHEPHGSRPYGTGDIVSVNENSDFVYIGRRDNMVKIRGRRIELEDVEAALLEHPALAEAAVVVEGDGLSAQLVCMAVVALEASEPSLLELKAHCFARLPGYMIIDRLVILQSMPRTANGKIDRLKLKGGAP